MPRGLLTIPAMLTVECPEAYKTVGGGDSEHSTVAGYDLKEDGRVQVGQTLQEVQTSLF